MQNPEMIEKFIAEIRADRVIGSLADEMAANLDELAIECDRNPAFGAPHAAFLWIIEQPRTAYEKLDAMVKIKELPKGQVHIQSLRTFLGWGN